jgi:hypothetical protein
VEAVMDCLYQAYSDHLADLGLQANWMDSALYRLLKWQTHGLEPQPTFGGVVPYIMHRLVAGRGSRLRIFIHHRLWTPEHYETIATKGQRRFIQQSSFGQQVEKILLYPAIYLDLPTHHAFYPSAANFYRTPCLNIVMAIQLQRRY